MVLVYHLSMQKENLMPTTPITPVEVASKTIPDSWLDVFNKAIQNNWDSARNRSIVKLKEVALAHRDFDILDLTAVKPVYERVGWTVHEHHYTDTSESWWVFLSSAR